MRSCQDLGICHARPGCSICITAMSIKTTKTNAHLQRVTPAPLRKSGLHAVEGALYSNVKKQPLERAAAFDARMRAIQVSAEMPIRNSTVDHKKRPYIATELAPSIRPGAMDFSTKPSGGYIEQAQREAARVAALPFVPTRKRA